MLAMPGLATIMSLPFEKSLSTMAVETRPFAPVTSASPLVTSTASILLAVKASMLGPYSNHEKATSTPSSLKKPF